MRVLRYLRKTYNIGITYGGQENPAINDALNIHSNSNSGTSTTPKLLGVTGFTDSDWAGDLETRKSTSGYAFLLYGGAVSWKSTKQSIVATSSTEAEYIACSDAAKEALWIRRLLAEIQNTPIPKPSFIESFDYHDIDIQDQLDQLRITPPTELVQQP
jgi:hypothetical protein